MTGIPILSMAHHYYIYFRVNPEHAKACATKVREIMSAVRVATGVNGRVLKKRGEPDLWMEVYEGIEDEANFEWALAEAVSSANIEKLLQPHTTRRLECFHD